MANTTNFGWETPDDTDLVKDGAAAMRTLGNAIDASLVDLKGGTTGQVLSKNTNTDMDFTWVTTDDANAIQNAIVDAKGDLIAASAADTPARLAVGANGETLVADSSASQGLSYQANWAAGKNKIINGAFDIWQRGTSVNLTNSTTSFLADRFSCLVNFSAGTASISRQTFTPGAAPVAGYEGQFFHRLNTGTTATYLEFNQRIEDVRTLAGQTITVSFWAKSSANVTLINLMRQNFGSGGSANVDKSTTFNITTSWVRYSWTITLDSVSGKTIGANSFLLFALYRDTGALGGLNIDIWGVQVEAGSVVTAFQTATGTLAGELAACQRYYWRAGGNAAFQGFGNGIGFSTTKAQVLVKNPVPMRTVPTGHGVNLLGLTDTVTTTGITASAIVQSGINENLFEFTVASGLTQYRPYIVNANNSTSAYLDVTAEL